MAARRETVESQVVSEHLPPYAAIPCRFVSRSNQERGQDDLRGLVDHSPIDARRGSLDRVAIMRVERRDRARGSVRARAGEPQLGGVLERRDALLGVARQVANEGALVERDPRPRGAPRSDPRTELGEARRTSEGADVST